MVLRTNKILLGAVILAIYCNRYAISMDWRERNAENVDLDEQRDDTDKVKCINTISGFCKANKEVPDTLVNYFSKRKSLFTNAPINPHRCACSMVNQMMYLGRSYYPRILENWVCKNDSCGTRHRCVEKKYSVRVLKLKEYLDTDSEPMCLAANLKGAWVPETLSVGVACECLPVLR